MYISQLLRDTKSGAEKDWLFECAATLLTMRSQDAVCTQTMHVNPMEEG